jgi:hypothetical protein
MGVSLDNAAVALPFSPSDTYYDLLRSACSSVSLRIPRTIGLSSAAYHALVNSKGPNPFQNCYEGHYSDQLALAVEYSKG